MCKLIVTTSLLLAIQICVTGQGTWELLNPRPSYRTGVDIHFLSADHGYIITNIFQLLETTDAGETWELKQTFSGYDYFEDFAFFDGLGLIVGEDGRVLKTTDNGDTWTEIDIGMSQDLHTVNMIDSETIYVSGSSQLAKSIDGSASWTVLDLPHEFTNSIVFTSTQVGHAAGKDGALFKTTDGGQNWFVAADDNDFTDDFISLYFINENMGYASLRNKELYKTTNGGENWEMIGDPDQLVYTFFFVDENTGYVGGYNGTLYKTTDGGESWESVEFQDDYFDHTNIYGLYFFDENVGFTVGNRGRITKTIDGGQTWSEYSPTYDDANQISFPVPEIGYIRLQTHDIFKSTDHGMTWENIGPPLAGKKTGPFQFIDENIGYVIAGGEHISDPKEFVYKTTDGGLSWSPTNGGNPLEADIGINSIYFLNEQNGFASGNRYAANKRVFRTTDGGATWVLVGEKRLTKMQFSSDEVGYGIGRLDNILYKTTDSGATWEELFVADAEITDLDFVNPNYGYIITIGSHMYKTENAGTDWQELEASPSSVLKNVDFVTNNFGYVSTGDKIFRTEDGGDTWAFEVQVASIRDICTTNSRVYTSGNHGKILASDHDVVSGQEFSAVHELAVNLFPNPADDHVYLSMEGEGTITTIAVFDITGRTTPFESFISDSQFKLMLPQLATGLYVVQITLEGKGVVSKKLVVH